MLKKVFRRQAYYIASAAFVLLSLLYTIAISNQAYVGLDLMTVNGRWIVTLSDPHGEGYKLGIRVGDQILRINNQDTGEYRFVQKWSQAEGASSIQYKRVDQSTDSIIEIPKSTVLLKLLSEMPMIILGVVFWIIGFITWYMRPFLDQARALFWLNLFIGLAIVIAPASSRDLIFARELEYITLSSVPLFLIQLFSFFPSENRNQINKFGRLVFASVLILIFILTILQSVSLIHFDSPLKRLVLSNLIIGVLLVLWNLATLFKLPNDKPEKNQVNILLLGLAIGFLPYFLLTAVPVIFEFQPIVNTKVSYLFISAVPATLYYVIVHKYLPDSRRLLGLIISFFVTGVIVSIVVSYILLTSKLVTTLNLEVYLATLTLTMSFIICSSFIRVAISKQIEKFAPLEGNRGIKRSVLKLNERLISINEEDRLLEEVVKSLMIEGALIVVEDDKGGYHKKAVGIFLEKPSEQIELEEYFQADQRINLEVKRFPDDSSVELYIPLVSNNFTCGIFLGHRNSRVKFEYNELPLVTLISSQLAQRLMTTFVIKDLSKEIIDLAQRSLDLQRRNQRLHGITGSLFKSIEQERKSLARDLHDGALQLALDLNRWLDDIAEECPSAKCDKPIKAIAHMREVVKNLNFELRSICSDLRPPSLNDLGLLNAIQILCEEKMENESVLISLETVGISEGVRLKEEVELAAYRFIQEGITNAVKHSGSSKTNIYIKLSDSEIELSIRDFGNGFDIRKIDEWPISSEHFGLIGMKERFQVIGGELQINSIIHQGTILKASIPR
ncbi:sensor histidine kinase [Desulfosporosinus sp. BICA1-9]|uniref:sensor histidine kinase n=1 Tax=Desulfosporosinus sp. BICA1-9 TaxID=1531958 RepID=UPI00054B9598|nr:ATP-binding protein [Desulfosporosinus sp. BICA1-9]KJS48632.1 MAG: histidine kinase [Peptococcaceae bacterium BRH_c23]KJS89082.1 MAG: histidine kinase [Desulfosporosinus sp. BICA1-9]